MINLSESTRGWIYRILLALQPLAVAYGFLTGDMAALWVNVGSAVLGLGLASAKTSIQSPAKHVADKEAN
jgi:hypothetical protein